MVQKVMNDLSINLGKVSSAKYAQLSKLLCIVVFIEQTSLFCQLSVQFGNFCKHWVMEKFNVPKISW